MKRTPIKRGGRKRKTYGTANETYFFKVGVSYVCGYRCVMDRHTPENCGGVLDAHHVISKHALKKRGLHGELWEAANGILLCRRHHERHENAVERVPRALLPPSALAFAERLGLEYLLERYPPEKAA